MNEVHHIDMLLHHLRLMLLRGDLGALAELGPVLEQALQDLAQAPIELETLAGLQAEAAQVGQLLEQALRGVQSARHRLEELSAVRRGRATYGGDGRRQQLVGEGGLGRRA